MASIGKWKAGVKKQMAQNIATRAVEDAYRRLKRTPDELLEELLENNTTHFSPDELRKLLLAFKRMTQDRLQSTQFYQVVEQELGWTNLVLRKQLFKAFDLDGHGDVDFREFCEAYSVMLRGTVPELLDFAWRVYHMQGSPDRVRIDDMYNVLRLALGGLEEVRRKQGKGAGGTSEESRFPDRSARAMLTAVFGQTKQLLTKREFSIGVLRHRMIVDCIVPGFELIPQDALHRAAEAGEVEEVQHLLEVDRLDVNGEDALQWPTTPLHLAAKMGHADIVRELIARGANPRLLGPEGETALDLSIENGKQGTLAAMLESGADPLMRNGAGRTPLHTAAACGNIKALDLLMPNLAQRVTTLRDKAGDTPVHCAALGDHFMAINTFLEYEVLCAADVDPAELNSANLRGETPLHVACMSRAYRTARRLLELGADKHALDLEGQGLLHKACAEGGNEVVLEMLLEDESEDGLDVDLQDNAGLTPLNICVSRRDIKMLKLLINAGADPNIAELSTGYTPLHKASLMNWFEGVDALVSTTANTEVLLDNQAMSPYDYARTPAITEILRDFIEETYKTADDNHPVVFDFGLVFDEGKWIMSTSGANLGERVLEVPKVPRDIRQQRIAAQLVDKDSILRLLKRAGLFVHAETVFLQEKALGIFSTGVRQVRVVRVGAPMYRIQLEAERMRLRIKRPGADATEFFLDHATFPSTGFEAFTRGERQMILMNIIEAPQIDSPLMNLRVENPPGEAQLEATEAGIVGRPASVADVKSAGIKVALYMRLLVVASFLVLHSPIGQEEVMAAWGMGDYRAKGQWRKQLRAFLGGKGALRPLQAVFKYFGSKLAFYQAFMAHLGRTLVLLAGAGILCFGILWVPLRPESDLDGSVSVSITYDHPIAYIFFGLAVVWAAVLVRTWAKKEAELRYRWRLDTIRDYPKTPSPQSTAVVKRLYVNNSWQYVPVATPAMLKARLGWIGTSIFLWLAFVTASVFSTWALVDVLVTDVIDETRSLHDNFDNPLEKDRNIVGTIALYGATAANAVAIYVLNAVWERVAVWLTYRENYGTVYEHDTALAIKLLSYQFVNSTLSLFYLAYYRKDFDKTAAMLAAIVVVGQLISLTLEYLFPWLSARNRGLNDEEAHAIAEVASQQQMLSHAGDDKESGGERPSTAGNKADDLAETGDLLTAGLDDKTQEKLRYEILAQTSEYSVEFSSVVTQIGVFMSFGCAWPLSAFAILIGVFVISQMDVWKFNVITQRPLSERWPGIGVFRVALEALIVIGIVNQCFFIALASDALEDYVLRSSDVELDTWRRLFIGFCLENVALAVYFAIRLWGSTRLASFMAEKSSETLRTVREAYQLGIRIREQRYQLMAINPATPLRQVCRFMGLDTPAADKYLAIVRFLDSLPAEERRAALLDNDLSISALTHRIELARRSLTWVDPGEAPTAAMLLKQLVPVVDLRQCYDLGKEFREAVWRAWNANSMRLISAPDLDPDQPRVVAAILQIAAFDIGITVRQGERYTKLCRFVEATPGNPYATLARMSKEYPSGILGFLEATASMSKQDAGDPLPSAIATVVEPIMLAKDAVDRGKALRRWMYEEWLTDMYLETDELLSRVVESKGSTVRACARYLLLLRYIEGLDPQRARAVLDVQRSSTLALWAQIKAMIDDGSWVDPGEPDFYEWTPPQNPPEWEKADFLSRVARGGGVSAVAGTARDTEASVARGSRKGTEGEEGEVEALAVAAKRNQVAPEPE